MAVTTLAGTTVEIRLLGKLEVCRAGRALPLPRSRKSRALTDMVRAGRFTRVRRATETPFNRVYEARR